jgi:hypothetical protein
VRESWKDELANEWSIDFHGVLNSSGKGRACSSQVPDMHLMVEATLRIIVWARRCTSLAFKVLLRWGVKEMDGLHSGWITELDTGLDS